ncbi:MAG: hypothetical protein K2K44_06055 [Oscillospiraceae bacterium]|nr:hypothetical protein [Oscillospiraceae bacterium]
MKYKAAVLLIGAAILFFAALGYTKVKNFQQDAVKANAEIVSVKSETEAYSQTEPPSEAGEAALCKRSFIADDKHVKPLGRSLMRDDVRTFTYTCSGIEFEFTGTSADIDVVCGGKVRIAVYLNDKMITDEFFEKGETKLEVFSSDVSEKCKIAVRKLSQVGGNYVGIKSINVVSENDISPTAEKSRSIEFIGDSVTCGYGIDSETTYDGFSGASENGSKSYAALTAEKLNAEYSICAYGGIGVYSSYSETSVPNQTLLIGELYGTHGMLEKDWDFSLYQPDLIVINMGANDNVWVNGREERKDKFGKAYYELISQVREANPDAHIICSFGVLGKGLMDEIREQAERFCKDTGDKKISCFEFEAQDIERDGYGTSYHPSAITHENMAKALSDHISELLGWK